MRETTILKNTFRKSYLMRNPGSRSLSDSHGSARPIISGSAPAPRKPATWTKPSPRTASGSGTPASWPSTANMHRSTFPASKVSGTSMNRCLTAVRLRSRSTSRTIPLSSHGPNGNPGKPPETAVIWRRSSSTIAILSACSACSRVSKPDRVSTI